MKVFLDANTAQNLMTPNPVSIHERSTVNEATRILNEKGISAIPVVDDAGQPVGVLSRADIVRHAGECFEKSGLDLREIYRKGGLMLPFEEAFTSELSEDSMGAEYVRRVMAAAVYSVAPETPALRVIEEMLRCKVHRLFVIEQGVLVGVISMVDILQRLRARNG